MSKATKFLVTALIAAGVSATAQAAPIITVINFEDLQACSITIPHPANCKASTQYAGLSFSSDNIAVAALADGGSIFFPGSPPAGDGPTFLLNSAAGASFSFDILAGYQLNSLVLDAAANTVGLSIFLVDINDVTTGPFAITGGNFDWLEDNIITLPTAGVKRVMFTTGVGGRFAIDDLQLDLTAPSPTIPEPASAGLVILALLGAAASRRRKQA